MLFCAYEIYVVVEIQVQRFEPQYEICARLHVEVRFQLNSVPKLVPKFLAVSPASKQTTSESIHIGLPCLLTGKP